eukprot:11522295-Alexandrium_andersonii.AAC.1
MLSTCPRCEKSLPVGATECEACSLSVEHQSTILCRLLRNPAIKNLMKIRSDAKMARNEPTMRQQCTRGGAVTGAMYLA